MPEHYPDEMQLPLVESGESPLHGYRGEANADPLAGVPAGLTVAISRETGSRGASIAQRAGEKLGWEVYSQELMDYIAQDATVRRDLLERLSPAARDWTAEELESLLQKNHLGSNPPMRDLARLVLSLGAQGNMVLLGRGAGFLLPGRSTLHVRLVAPIEARIAYTSQCLRLTIEEATEQVKKRDEQRSEFIATYFHRQANDVHAFDMVLNTALLGEDRCATIIVAAAKAKMSALVGSN